MTDEERREVDEANASAWSKTILRPSQALEEARSALARAEACGYEKGQADAQLNVGWASYYTSMLPDAFSAFSEALQRYERLGDTLGLCKTHNAFGVYNHSLFLLDKAIERYTESLRIARENGHEERELVAMANLGEVCLELGNPQEALSYLMPAYDRIMSGLGRADTPDCLRNIGQCFLAMDNLTMAAEFTRRAYEVAAEADDSMQAADCLETLAGVAIALGAPEEAERNVERGLRLARQTGNRIQEAGLLIARATAYNERGQSAEALGTLGEAVALCGDIKLKGKLPKAHEQMSRAYAAMGDYEKALEYYRRFADFRAQVQHEETANKLRNVRYEAEVERARQSAEIYRLRNIDLKEKSDELSDTNRRLTSISTIGRLVTASLDFGTVVQTVYDNLSPLLSMDMFGIALYDEARGQLVYRRYFEDGVRKSDWRISMDSPSSFAAWAYRNRRPVLIADKEAEYQRYLSRPSTSKGKPCDSIVCMPLSIEDRSIGVMTVQSYRKAAYEPRTLAFLEALAPFVAIAIENSLIHDRLEDLNRALSDEKRRLERATLKISHLANHDTLTSLPNRRLLFELTAKALESAKRSGGKIGVMFIDLDDFKPINDEYGHAAGDSALVAMAERLRGLMRASDIVARIGGDEFVAVVTNARSLADIEKVARKVIEECARPLPFSGGSRPVGLSMGVSVFPEDGESVEDLINRADAAMYGVKHGRKHAFAFAGPREGLAEGRRVID